MAEDLVESTSTSGDRLMEMLNVSGPTTAGNSTVLPMPQYFDVLFKVVGFLSVAVIFVVGLIGNVMVILVVWRTRSMRTPTNCYLVSLAIADILLLVSAPLPTLIEFFLIVNQSVYGAVGCAAMVRVNSRLLPTPPRSYVFIGVCFIVSRITQKQFDRYSRNTMYVKKVYIGKGRNDWILW